MLIIKSKSKILRVESALASLAAPRICISHMAVATATAPAGRHRKRRRRRLQSIAYAGYTGKNLS